MNIRLALGQHRAVLLTGLIGLVLAFMPALSRAQSGGPFPSRAITLVVPSEAGGTVDPVARSLAQQLTIATE